MLWYTISGLLADRALGLRGVPARQSVVFLAFKPAPVTE